MPKKHPEIPKFPVPMEEFQKSLSLIINTVSGSIPHNLLTSKLHNIEEIFPDLYLYLQLVNQAAEMIEKYKNINILHWDEERLREFLIHNEIFCRMQGSLAVLLVIGEQIKPVQTVARVTSKHTLSPPDTTLPPSPPQPKTPVPQKSRKSKRR